MPAENEREKIACRLLTDTYVHWEGYAGISKNSVLDDAKTTRRLFPSNDQITERGRHGK
jgi:hypothetical protein